MHWRRWGVVYILAVLFLASWAAQLVAQLPKIGGEGWTEFWSATFENWQSEWLQLATQAWLVVGLADRVFTKSKEDVARLESKVDALVRAKRGTAS